AGGEGRGRQAVAGLVRGRGVGRRGVLRLPVFGPWDSTRWGVGYDMLCPGGSYNPECSCCQALQALAGYPSKPAARRGYTSVVSSAYSSSLIRSSSSLLSSIRTRSSQPEP